MMHTNSWLQIQVGRPLLAAGLPAPRSVTEEMLWNDVPLSAPWSLHVSRVLIVEDHQKLLASLRRGLELLGHEVLTAETGEQGYELALRQNVDIVVLDLMLPGKNGFEILADLRKASFCGPVLILTAEDSPEDRSRGRACGADGFLIKPFAFTELVSRLNALLAESRCQPPPPEEPPCAG